MIRKIDEETSKITIPESVSPEAMKKMLLEENSWNKNDEENSSNEKQNRKEMVSPKQKQRKLFGGLVAVAGLAICLTIGGVATIRYTGEQLSDASNIIENIPSIVDKTEKEKYKESLAYSTDYESPESYEDYYKVLNDAYQDYKREERWENILNSRKDDVVYETEGAVEDFAAEESVMEDSINTNSVRGDYDMTSTEASADSAESKSGDYTKTNNQEQNVEESDVVKTDGTYIYKMIRDYESTIEKRFQIVKTDNGELTNAATIELEKTIREFEGYEAYIDMQEFYIYENYLVFMYSKVDYEKDSKNETTIMLYDISNPEKPSLKKVFHQSGWYATSRISNGYLYTISRYNNNMGNGKKRYEEYIPYINDEAIECKDIYYEKDYIFTGGLVESYVITSLNLNEPTGFTDQLSITADSSDFYVSSESIFFYARKYNRITETQILKIQYNDGMLEVGNTVCVAGYLYDSFALNEHNGYLRIVATIGRNDVSLLRVLGDESAESTMVDVINAREDVNVLYVLDDNMEMTGKILNIAPGEIIYSARFFGDVGYFVTYKNTDPLFSVDLSDPTNPKIIGALKIPGFSNYLHFYEDGLLLGLGQETDPETQRFLGLKLSMFDISDPTNVTESDKYILEDGEYAPALYDHKALMIDPTKNVFGFEYYACDYETYEYQYYYVTYRYENGFIETARYLLDEKRNGIPSRGIYIGNYLYLVTEESVTSYKLGDEKPIETVYFE